MVGNKLTKAIDPNDPKTQMKANKIQRRVDLVQGEIDKIEEECMDTIDTGLKCIEDVFRTGLSWKNLSVESTIFYQKMEADLNRYKLEIFQYRNREDLANGIEPDETETQDLVKETKLIYIETCEECEQLENTNPLKLGLYLNYGVFLYEICDLIEDSRFVLKKCFDEAIKDLERLNERELSKTLPPLQAIKDNYELWALDVLSDRKKAEIAQLEEQARVNALK